MFLDGNPGSWLMGLSMECTVGTKSTWWQGWRNSNSSVVFFSLDTRLSLLLYPFFRHPTQAGTCGYMVVLSIYTADRKVRLRTLKSWEWLLFMQLCCLLPGSSSFPVTFSLLGNAPKPTYFPLNNNNPATFLLSYLPSFGLLPCISFSELCVHWTRESVL